MSYYFYCLLLLYGLSFGLGVLVVKDRLSVYDSRKILSISFFLIASYFLVQNQSTNIIYSFLTPLLWLASLSSFVRRRIKFFHVCFYSIDRPQDRPYTLLWLVTSLIVGYWILIFFIEILRIYDAAHLIFITVFASTFGDGLAEPIGQRYGRHRYKVKALFTNRIYDRSYEGSACVLLATVSATMAMYPFLSFYQFCAMMLIMPIALTLAEAKSPHTWDNPFIHLVGGLLTLLFIQI